MTGPKRDRSKLYAAFDAKWLPPLKAFQDFNHETGGFLGKGCITIEPCSAGGVFIVAVTGFATAVIHDARGYASRAMHIMVPDDAFAAAEAPEPVRMTCEGWNYECELPEWAQPDDVHVFDAGMFVTTKMRHPQWAEAHKYFHPALYNRVADQGPHIRPGLDFRISEGRTVDWPTLLRAAREGQLVEDADWHFNPWVVKLFDPLLQVLVGDEARAVCHRTVINGRANRMAVMTVTGRPEFAGFWMHSRSLPRQDLAASFFAPASTHEAPEAAQ